MPRYLIQTFSSDPGGEDFNFSYAIVEIDKELAEIILRRRELYNDVALCEPSLCVMLYMSFVDEWYSSLKDKDGKSVLPEDLQQFFDGHNWVKLPDDFEMPPEPESEDSDYYRVTENNLMRIMDDGVLWSCIPRHSTIKITTEALPYWVVQEVLGIGEASDSDPEGSKNEAR